MKIERNNKVRKELQLVLGLALVAALVFWWSQSAVPVPGDAGQPPGTSQGTQTKPASKVTGSKQQPNTVAAKAAAIADASTFNKLLVRTGVSATLSGKGPYALFLPTNEAMKLLPSGTVANMTAAQLKRFVEYHVIAGRAVDSSAVMSGNVTALSGDPLNFQTGSEGAAGLVNSSRILETVKVGNGTIYIINQALLPPAKPR